MRALFPRLLLVSAATACSGGQNPSSGDASAAGALAAPAASPNPAASVSAGSGSFNASGGTAGSLGGSVAVTPSGGVASSLGGKEAVSASGAGAIGSGGWLSVAGSGPQFAAGGSASGSSSTAGGANGGGGASGASGSSAGASAGAAAFPPATFTEVYEQVFLEHCYSNGCHNNSRRHPYFGTKQDTYEFFVQPNVIFPGQEPAWSGIYQVMAWEIMPPAPRPQVPQEGLDLVAGWILAGALND